MFRLNIAIVTKDFSGFTKGKYENVAIVTGNIYIYTHTYIYFPIYSHTQHH